MRISQFSRSYLRVRAVELMSDECVIFRPGNGGKVTYNPSNRQATVGSGTTIYSGPCRMWEVTGGSPVILADDELVVSQLWLSIPYNAAVPEPEDQVRITDSDDESLVGRHVKIMSIVRGGGLRASRRMQVQFIDSKKVSW